MPLVVTLPLLLWPAAWGFTAGGADGLLSRRDGALLLGGAILYAGWLLRRRSDPADLTQARRGWAAMLALLAGGMVLLVAGCQVTVSGALGLARAAGLSEAVIGLTVVALGTSLPELATSATAAWKGNADIAVGNILGSNIFNILLILGVTALIRPVPFVPGMRPDVLMTALSGLLLWMAVLPACGHRLGRAAGAAFILAYAGYVAWLLGGAVH
jgi:cation:H+ antiporter